MSYIQLNYAFLLFGCILGEFHWKRHFLFKKWHSQKRAEKYSESLFFSTVFKRGKSRRKFGFVVNNLFVQSSKMGQILTKTVFLFKMIHIQLNYAFLLFWNILGKIHWKNHFLFKNDYLKKKHRKTQKDYFSKQIWEGENPEENFVFGVNNCFFFKALKWTNINKNCFSRQNEPHTAKLCFPAFSGYFI